MTSSYLRWILLAAVLVACGDPTPRLLVDPSRARQEVRAACALTEQRCTRCHTLGRLFSTGVSGREQWEPVVNRMRHLPSSGISPSDADVILTCLAELR